MRSSQWMLALLIGGSAGIGSAQAPPNGTVKWTATLVAQSTLELSGAIDDGWHVYALTQPPGGPTALRITVDDNEVAQAVGAPSGTVPQKRRDPSFGLETRFYTHSFTIRLPLQLKQPAAAGQQLIPVSVRFQTCSDRECQPPTTIHLSVALDPTSQEAT
jgi:hypothetical protein